MSRPGGHIPDLRLNRHQSLDAARTERTEVERVVGAVAAAAGEEKPATVRQKLWSAMGILRQRRVQLRDRFGRAAARAYPKQGDPVGRPVDDVVLRSPSGVLKPGYVADDLRRSASGTDLLQLAVRVKRNPPSIGRPDDGGRIETVGACQLAGLDRIKRPDPQRGRPGFRGSSE